MHLIAPLSQITARSANHADDQASKTASLAEVDSDWLSMGKTGDSRISLTPRAVAGFGRSSDKVTWPSFLMNQGKGFCALLIR